MDLNRYEGINNIDDRLRCAIFAEVFYTVCGVADFQFVCRSARSPVVRSVGVFFSRVSENEQHHKPHVWK